MLNPWFLVLLSALFHHVIGQPSSLQNITIDDTNYTRIIYTGSWVRTIPDDFDYGGSHSYSTDPSATATFTFTG